MDASRWSHKEHKLGFAGRNVPDRGEGKTHTYWWVWFTRKKNMKWSIHPFLVYWELFLTMYRIIFPQPPLNPRWRRYWIQNEHRILVRDSPRYLNELFVIRAVQFSIEYRKLSGIASFLLNSLCDWSSKVAPPSQPIKSRTKINSNLVTRVFPRFKQVASFYFEFS